MFSFSSEEFEIFFSKFVDIEEFVFIDKFINVEAFVFGNSALATGKAEAFGGDTSAQALTATRVDSGEASHALSESMSATNGFLFDFVNTVL
jgi:hypothetical protein